MLFAKLLKSGRTDAFSVCGDGNDLSVGETRIVQETGKGEGFAENSVAGLCGDHEGGCKGMLASGCHDQVVGAG